MRLSDSTRAASERKPEPSPPADWLPQWISRDGTIPPAEKAVLGVVAGHAYGAKDWSNPGTGTIAAAVGRDPGHVRRLIRSLAARGLVEVRGSGRARVFVLPWKRAPAPPVAGAGAPDMRAPARPEESRGNKTTKTAVVVSHSPSTPEPEAPPCPAVSAAVAHFGPGAAERARTAVAASGADWVLRAVGLAVKRKATSWGYVTVTLANWHREGGPLAPAGRPSPPPPPRAPFVPLPPTPPEVVEGLKALVARGRQPAGPPPSARRRAWRGLGAPALREAPGGPLHGRPDGVVYGAPGGR